MVKGMYERFQPCLDPFSMLFFEGCSEAGPIRDWSNLFFRVHNLGKYISYEDHLLFENVFKI